jgi:hypothetical protein
MSNLLASTVVVKADLVVVTRSAVSMLFHETSSFLFFGSGGSGGQQQSERGNTVCSRCGWCRLLPCWVCTLGTSYFKKFKDVTNSFVIVKELDSFLSNLYKMEKLDKNQRNDRVLHFNKY